MGARLRQARAAAVLDRTRAAIRAALRTQHACAATAPVAVEARGGNFWGAEQLLKTSRLLSEWTTAHAHQEQTRPSPLSISRGCPVQQGTLSSPETLH